MQRVEPWTRRHLLKGSRTIFPYDRQNLIKTRTIKAFIFYWNIKEVCRFTVEFGPVGSSLISNRRSSAIKSFSADCKKTYWLYMKLCYHSKRSDTFHHLIKKLWRICNWKENLQYSIFYEMFVIGIYLPFQLVFLGQRFVFLSK